MKLRELLEPTRTKIILAISLSLIVYLITFYQSTDFKKLPNITCYQMFISQWCNTIGEGFFALTLGGPPFGLFYGNIALIIALSYLLSAAIDYTGKEKFSKRLAIGIVALAIIVLIIKVVAYYTTPL